MHALAVAAVGALTVIAAPGCGGHDHSAVLRQGRAIFVHSCARCHTVAGRESGAVGGDLVNANLSTADLASFARVMPVRPPLARAEAAAVAAYVDSVAARLRR